MLAHEAIVEEKDAEIASLKAQREVSRASDVDANSINGVSENSVVSKPSTVSHGRQDKAPPVDSYTGSDLELRYNEWLPTLELATQWNSWRKESDATG